MTTPRTAFAHDVGKFHWDDAGGGEYQAVDKNGIPKNRFISYSKWQEMTQRAAAGAIDGGGAVPKGFSTQIVNDGKAYWSKLKSTTATGVKAGAWRELKSAAMWFMQDLKAAPLLTKLSAISLGASAFDLGWKIGGGEGSIWGFLFGEKGSAPSGGTVEWEALKLVPFDKATADCTIVPPAGGATCTSGGGLSRSIFVVQWKNVANSTTSLKKRMADHKECSAHWAYGSGPPGMGTVTTGTEPCKAATVPIGYAYTEIEITCIPGQTTEGCAGKSYGSTQEAAAPTPLEGEAATKASEECFRGESECGAIPGWWWNHDPKAQADSHGTDLLSDADPLAVQVPALPPGITRPDWEELLEEQELIPKPAEITWKELEEKLKEEEVKKDQVIWVWPKPGTYVDSGEEIEFGYTPDFVVVPPPNKEGLETYEHYATRLEELGLTPQKIPLPEYATDPSTGPEGASQPIPKAGTPVAPGTTVPVQTNPNNAPTPANPGGGGWTPPAIPPIDFTPLLLVTPCDVFPFGAACWLVEAATELEAPGVCPTFDVYLHGEREMSLCSVSPVVEGVRPWLIFVGAIFIVLTFASWARQGGTPNESEPGQREED